MRVGRPEMHDRVCAPRSPPFGERRDVPGSGGSAERTERAPNAQVRRQEGIGVAEGAHPDVRSRPWTDTGQVEQGPLGLLAIRPDVEVEAPARERRRQSEQSPLDAQPGGRESAGSAASSCSGVGNSRVRPPDARPQRLSGIARRGARRAFGPRNRDLLTEDRADRDLGQVHGSRDAPARPAANERAE